MLDPQSRSRMFPTLDAMTYLNTAAEGIPSLAVGAALQTYFSDHQLGMDGRERHMAQLAAAREQVASLYGLSAEETAICSCSSEAYNLAGQMLQLRPGDEIVINDLDFPAGVTPWLQPSCPATVKLWRARGGGLRVEDLVPLLNPGTRLVPVSLVSFFNGFSLNLQQVVETVRKHSSALVSVDVTQALGRVPLDLRGADLIVSSTHKWILATHGGGLVGVPSARKSEWTSTAGGWFHLVDAFGAARFERAVSKPGAAGFAIGMPNFPVIYAIRAALDYIQGVGVEAIDRAARPLTLACHEALKKLPIEMLTPNELDAIAGILAFRHAKADALHRRLRERNVHVMSHAGRLRVAIHGYNTAAEVEIFVRELGDALRVV